MSARVLTATSIRVRDDVDDGGHWRECAATTRGGLGLLYYTPMGITRCVNAPGVKISFVRVARGDSTQLQMMNMEEETANGNS